MSPYRSNFGSVNGTLSVTFSVSTTSFAGSVTTDHVGIFGSSTGSFTSVVSSVLVTLVAVLSVTPDRHDISVFLDGLIMSVVVSSIVNVSDVLVESISGRLGSMSSGSVSVFWVLILFDLGQCLGQCLSGSG